ncbi:hypothetical protein Fot_35232 [Forsythia ovata]|uniref:Uncharacterized protein n=1 Tax=Forsythia ovata TaxID=205694 RepID=A0ABD1SNP8_9LAMI
MSSLGDLHDEAVEETDTDDGDFDELGSLGSDGEFRCANIYKEFEFNANVDLTNLQFKIGIFIQLTLETKDLKSGTSTLVTSMQWSSWQKRALVEVGNSWGAMWAHDLCLGIKMNVE